ncbi:hypothetical protein C8R46DRAFT_1209036 [Mycena filopes]|nr:hypothetical protein C8R46DRAFT_1234875 [Mycena filopes]KAJ7136267.1 hypothetical protein C8R46DRAFT_1234799 [Mycena filopes]KAJ7149605.1 hypothetical protein C8R46DRAFT_1230284 [Mycena filopes]KAJ7162887.1 hypothetical protein C8R46DRAFT_1221695 [Mycena filopes]KAJ7184844.1 hypothetical protein C8R46DRAFT_1209036 [Mycena filopes]
MLLSLTASATHRLSTDDTDPGSGLPWLILFHLFLAAAAVDYDSDCSQCAIASGLLVFESFSFAFAAHHGL